MVARAKDSKSSSLVMMIQSILEKAKGTGNWATCAVVAFCLVACGCQHMPPVSPDGPFVLYFDACGPAVFADV